MVPSASLFGMPHGRAVPVHDVALLPVLEHLMLYTYL